MAISATATSPAATGARPSWSRASTRCSRRRPGARRCWHAWSSPLAAAQADARAARGAQGGGDPGRVLHAGAGRRVTIAAGFADPALGAQATLPLHFSRRSRTPAGSSWRRRAADAPCPAAGAGLRRGAHPARLRDAALARPVAGDAPAVIDEPAPSMRLPDRRRPGERRASPSLCRRQVGRSTAFDAGHGGVPGPLDDAGPGRWKASRPRPRRAADRPRASATAHALLVPAACRTISGQQWRHEPRAVSVRRRSRLRRRRTGLRPCRARSMAQA